MSAIHLPGCWNVASFCREHFVERSDSCIQIVDDWINGERLDRELALAERGDRRRQRSHAAVADAGCIRDSGNFDAGARFVM